MNIRAGLVSMLSTSLGLTAALYSVEPDLLNSGQTMVVLAGFSLLAGGLAGFFIPAGGAKEQKAIMVPIAERDKHLFEQPGQPQSKPKPAPGQAPVMAQKLPRTSGAVTRQRAGDDTPTPIFSPAVLASNIPARVVVDSKLIDAALDSALDVIFITNTDSTIIYANPAFERVTGYKVDYAIGKTPRLFKSGLMPESFYDALWDTLLSGRPWEGEIINKHPDGDYYNIHISIAPVKDAGGQIANYVSVMQNITERKKAEDALRKSKDELEVRVAERTAELRTAKENAEAATKLKDQFVSLVSHDLRAPFTALLGYLQLVTADNNVKLADKHRDWIGKATASGENLLKMIEDLLKISRLQTGKIVPDKRFLDGSAIVASVISSLKTLADRKNVAIENLVPKYTRLHVDRNLFTEVVQNLISNSIKFCKEGDKITIYRPENKPAAIAVKDTGKGISPTLLPNLFKHEVKTTTTGTAGEKGTGLGLPFCYDIMKAHGGDLMVSSEQGSGATFIAALQPEKPLVLLVDDDVIIRELFLEHLRMVDAEVVEVENGKAAWDLLESGARPYLIISDINMPEMTGLELLEKVRSNPVTKYIPMLMITSSRAVEDREKAFNLGASDFVNKPLDVSEFIPRLRRILS